MTFGRAASMLVGVFGLEAPSSYVSPWTDTDGTIYEEPARVAAYADLWDSSAGRFSTGDEISRAEFARAVVIASTGDDPCPRNPFTASRIESLRDRYPGQTFTAYAYDTRTGCAYWMNPDLRLRTASVFKVLVMAGTLLEAQEAGRQVSDWEWGQLVPMITESANNPVRALWRSFGASPWFGRQADIYGMTQTTPVGDTQRVWGRTTTSAKDQADLLRQVLRGEWGPLDAPYRLQAWELMTSVIPSQTWGVTNEVPSGWTVAQKNGFAGHIANSVGFVTEPGGEHGYVIAVLSNGWSNWTRGVPTVDEISGWVAESLAS
jgi:beta-lactamase class A